MPRGRVKVLCPLHHRIINSFQFPSQKTLSVRLIAPSRHSHQSIHAARHLRLTTSTTPLLHLKSNSYSFSPNGVSVCANCLFKGSGKNVDNEILSLPISKTGKTQGLGLEVPSLYSSPGPSVDGVDRLHDESVARKRSGELLFADPRHIGHQF